MGKYVAVFLALLIAVSAISTVGAITTTKAEAKKPVPPPPLPQYYQIPVGVNQQWTAQQLNLHVVYVDPTTTAKHTETSSGNAAAVSISAQKDQTGYNYALVGVQWELTGISDWTLVKDLPVTVTVTLQYSLTTTGTSWNESRAGVSTNYNDIAMIFSGSRTNTETVTYTQNQNGDPLTIADLAPSGGTGDYHGNFYVGAWNVMGGLPVPLKTTGSASVSSISLQYT